MEEVVILGAGMAGFGAAHCLHNEGRRAVIFEKNSYHGGTAATFTNEGFIFDDGPHISFTKNKRLRQLFDLGANNQVETFDAYVDNIWIGHRIKHPAQVNLHGLPEELVVKIILEQIELKTVKQQVGIKNYKEWLYASFGKTFAETFPMKYGKKFHTVSAENMATDWIGPRLYRPEIEEVLKGALSSETKDVHYVNEFHYPTTGGFVSFFNAFLPQAEINLQHKAEEIDLQKKSVRFKNGKTVKFDHLISSVPLPELIPMIKDVPEEVLKAAEKLACTSCVVVNLGIKRQNLSQAHWTYVYDEDIVFTRLNFPHLLSPSNVPDGCGSIQVESYFSKKYKPLEKDPKEYIELTIKDLIRCGILAGEDEIVFKEARLIGYANVIFDLDRIPNLKIVHAFLDEAGIRYCGRYGEWKYLWTDTSFLSGEKAARKVLEEIKN